MASCSMARIEGVLLLCVMVSMLTTAAFGMAPSMSAGSLDQCKMRTPSATTTQPLKPLRGGSSVSIKTKLMDLGQAHLFEGLDGPQTEKLLAQAAELNQQLPGGLEAYVSSAKKLLKSSAEGVNPFQGFTPSIPHGEVLKADTPEFLQLEGAGLKELKHAGFVLVAGGLGERLGYNGIKISLPLYETERQACFMYLYAQHILTIQRNSGASMIPLAIMTSDDTHQLTVQLLKEHNNFGLSEGQVTIMKQNKVPALKDSEAHFASKDGVIETKPHGHGDVHTLMHQTGLAKKWRDSGIRWVIFFQDTNGIIFRALPAVVGVSAKHKFCVNSVCVPRTPGEAVGGLVRLEHSDGRKYTVNVEYNQLDSLLRSSEEFSQGDVADPHTGHSPFPGNINILVFSTEEYSSTLERTSGVVNEFVNPKYADATKTQFKSPTRLECMMQDFPMLLAPDAKVGFTQIDRWLCFSPVKNNIADAAAKAAKDLPPECAGTAERDAYTLNANMLRMCGCDIPEQGFSGVYGGVPLTFAPLITLLPSFGTCITDVNAHIGNDADVTISSRSALTLSGHVDIVGLLKLDGALVIKAAEGARVTVNKLVVVNEGWQLRSATKEEEDSDEMVKMRGYKIHQKATKEYIFDKPGDYVIDE